MSSWAAAVTSSVPEGSGNVNGFTMLLRTIPYNYYALLTIVMSLFLTAERGFGPCFEAMSTTPGCRRPVHHRRPPLRRRWDAGKTPTGPMLSLDLVLPVVVLIVTCIIGLIYTGGYYDQHQRVFPRLHGRVLQRLLRRGPGHRLMLALVFTFIYFWLGLHWL